MTIYLDAIDAIAIWFSTGFIVYMVCDLWDDWFK